MVSSISQSTGSNLQELLRSSQKGHEEVLEQSDLASATLASGLDSAITISAQAAHASQNMMSRNFASVERRESKYTQAMIQGLKANQQMNGSKQNTLMSIMQHARVEYENAEELGEKYMALKRAEKQISWHQEDEVRKSAEETHLKESKNVLEEKATVPKDENGEPINTGTADNTGEEVSTPEIAGSNPVSASDVTESAPVIATASAVVSTPAPDVSVPTIPSTPSIDIVV